MTEQWGVYELILKKELESEQLGENPYQDYQVEGTFTGGEECKRVRGFYNGNQVFVVRFMPSYTGIYHYELTGSQSGMKKKVIKAGDFTVGKAAENNHGPVKVAEQYHFAYADGTPYQECGTTCYAWLHQRRELREQTLMSLQDSPFNKIRFCVFPKHYDYNLYEPETYPYEGTPCSIVGLNKENFQDYTPENQENRWDFYRFCPEHFAVMDTSIKELANLGIEADIILFHPYDRWGFSRMGREAERFYLSYMIARYGAFRNIWWSLANEYDLFPKKSIEDFEYNARTIVEEDCYEHLRSIHNCFKIYDFTKTWVTHCSIQRTDIYESASLTRKWREKYGKPVVLDEVGYEGNINFFWGNLTAEEMVHLFWIAVVRGGYCGHGETYIDQVDTKTGRMLLWWSHGGKLYGESQERIRFLMEFMKTIPGYYLKPADLKKWHDNAATAENEQYKGEFYLFYTGIYRSAFREFYMDDLTKYQVTVIDTWNMTTEDMGIYSGKFYITLPSKPYIAIVLRKEKEIKC